MPQRSHNLSAQLEICWRETLRRRECYLINMKIKATTGFFFMVVCAITISCYNRNASKCKLELIRRLYYDENMQPGIDTGFGHTVLLRDFSRKCMDSAIIIKIALSYIDTANKGKPINGIAFYSSDKNFIPGEHSQVMEEINKDCLVDISFDRKTKRPITFIFYNEDGEIVYWGNRWVPFPKGEDIYKTDPNIK
jgi:hypothetical protein